MVILQDLTNVEISHLTFDGYTNTNIIVGISAYQGGNHYLHNLTIQNLLGTALAIHLNGPTVGSVGVGTTNCRICNNSISNIGTNWVFGGGIRCSWGSSGNAIIGNTIALTGRGGIFGDNYSSGMVVQSNIISGSGLSSQTNSLYGALGIEEWGNCDQALVEDNILDHWLSISGSSHAAVRRNIVSCPAGPVIGLCGLEMVMGTNCLFTDNLVNGGQQIGISISGGPVDYCFWCSNTIENMMSWAVQDQGPCNGHYFFGNKFLYTQASAESLYPTDAGSAFRINTDCTNITLEANIIQSNASSAIEFFEPLEQLTFIGNMITSNSAVENGPPTGTTDLLWTNNTVSGNKRETVPGSVGFTSNQLPIAAFSAPGAVSVGQPVTFTNASTAPGSSVAGMLWDFGEGIPSTATNPVFTYIKPGTYRVSLVLWNTQGHAARTEEFIRVSIPAPSLMSPIFRDNQLIFEVVGASNYSYVVQTSTDLVNWVSLQTNAAPFMFSNSVPSNSPCRFYRGAF